MIAANVAYDLGLVAHIALGVATLVVLGSLRILAAEAMRTGATLSADRFPDRVNWVARVVHLMPISGVILSVSGNSDVSLRQPFVQVGFALYLVAAYVLEAWALPQERKLVRAVRSGEMVSPSAKKLGRSLDLMLTMIAAAFVVMVVQF